MSLKLRDFFKRKARPSDATIVADPDAAFNEAALALRNGDLQSALRLFNAFIAVHPDHSEAHYKRANILNSLGFYAQALLSYDRTVDLDANHSAAYCNRGTALERLQRLDEALASYDHALAINAGDHLALFNRGLVLRGLKRFDEAASSFQRAVALKDDYVEAHINLGNTLFELRRFDEALNSYDSAIAHGNGFEQAFLGRGLVQFQLRQFEDALRSFDVAIALNAVYAEAHVNRGNALHALLRHADALASHDRAIELTPGLAEAHQSRGAALTSLGRLNEAVISHDRAIELDPSFAGAHQGRGSALLALKQFERAIASYRTAYELNPDVKILTGTRRYVQMQICDWTDLDSDMQTIDQHLRAGHRATATLPLLALCDSPELHRVAAQIWTREECPEDDSLGAILSRPAGAKIRVGYFSADFRIHAVSLLTAELFELHDRARFEIIAFAFGPKGEDEMTARLRRAFDRFIDIRNLSDKQAATLAREIGIDIAVDLGGYTEYCRTGIFALRAAPIQMSYIGYLGTMGAPYMDYLAADPTLIPIELRAEYSEKIVSLPSYQVNDSQRRDSGRKFSREELGLPPSGFVFSCFNSNYKITPVVFAVWMRILARTTASCLFLYVDNDVAQRNLRNAAREARIDPTRLVFGKRLGVGDYLARYRSMDLFLDTLPYNAGATASDALWMGLPVLTCRGRSFAARYGASLLTAIGLPELIAESLSEYEEMAIALADDRVKLATLRERLEGNRGRLQLFDSGRFTRNLESAYQEMYARHRDGLPPAHIDVAVQAR